VSGLTCPGQRMKAKVRIEPSVASPSAPRNGPGLPISGNPNPEASQLMKYWPDGPLSEAKTTMVLSSIFKSFSASRTCPTW
jgi:hypothetical protein